jgi:outer membrane protein OmpA-like peptidoglycan-associated protein
VEAMAQNVIEKQDDLKGYPIDVNYNNGSNTLTVTGLFPSEVSMEGLRGRLKGALPDLSLAIDAGWLPEGKLDPSDFTTPDDLASVEERLRDDMKSSLVKTNEEINVEAAALARSQNNLREEMTSAFDSRFASLSEMIASIEQHLPTPIEREMAAFEAWLANQAVRFDDDSEISDEAKANGILHEIVERMSALPSHIGLRVIGYSDELGEDSVSARISRSRAALVGDMLIERGVMSDRLQVVGRGNERRIVNIDGTGSINRRVEFEIVHLGEGETSDGAVNGER